MASGQPKRVAKSQLGHGKFHHTHEISHSVTSRLEGYIASAVYPSCMAQDKELTLGAEVPQLIAH